MKCPHCNGEHPDNYRFCPETGLEIVPQFKACTNEGCPDYGKDILPLEAKFCPRCGKPIESNKSSVQDYPKDPMSSQIVITCSRPGASICVGDKGKFGNKYVFLKEGENIITCKDYFGLINGFYFRNKGDAEGIEKIDLSNYVPIKVTDMSNMFYGCSALKSINLSGLDTSNVTDMSYMFSDCSSLESLDLSGFDTSKVTDMSFMFTNCNSLKSLNLTGFDTSDIIRMRWMFAACQSLKSLDLSGFDTSNVTDMNSMFGNCSSLKSLDLSGFDTSNVTDMSYMFGDCSSLRSLDLSGFDTSNVTDMASMFSDCSSLESLDLSSFDTSNASTDRMFRGCSKKIQKQYECLL